MGQAVADKKLIDAEAELTQITGQKAVRTRSRKRHFELQAAYNADRRARVSQKHEDVRVLIAVALPRIRFQGYQREVRRPGHPTLGITEQIIFPEIDIDKITKIFGMEITFVTTAKLTRRLTPCSASSVFLFKNAKRINKLWQRI